MTKEKPTSAVAGVASVVTQINATLATIERDITVTVTTVNKDTQTDSATGTSGLLAELRSLGLG